MERYFAVYDVGKITCSSDVDLDVEVVEGLMQMKRNGHECARGFRLRKESAPKRAELKPLNRGNAEHCNCRKVCKLIVNRVVGELLF